MNKDKHLVLGVTGASGAYAASMLVERSSWPIALIMSSHGRAVYERECGSIKDLEEKAAIIYDDNDLAAPVSSGSVPTAGMVVLPCSINTLGRIASGLSDTLITRTAHCHLKEQRKLLLCVRETPWSGIDFDNAKRVCSAGGIVMPLSPPFYMFAGEPPAEVSLHDLMGVFIDRVLALLGKESERTWEDLC